MWVRSMPTGRPNLALLQPEPELDLYSDHVADPHPLGRTPGGQDRAPGQIVNSMVSNGCVVRGMVDNSVLSPGVYVSPGAVVKDSVVMNDAWIGPARS